MVKVITINILFELDRWEQRRHLLVSGLAAERADLIALQEVKLPEDTAVWLAEQLGMPYLSLVPTQSYDGRNSQYGVAILSRHPFVQQDTLYFQSQGKGKVAQYVQVEIDNQPLVVCNGHYYWHPGSHPERDKQVKQVLNWLEQFPPEMPIVAVGDFNGTPDTSAIALMRQHFTSAYAKYNGSEPSYTCPTPLVKLNWLQSIRHTLRNLVFNKTLTPWKGTLDYIFVNSNLSVCDCRIILNQPSPYDPYLYPSDHFGIAANLQLERPDF